MCEDVGAPINPGGSAMRFTVNRELFKDAVSFTVKMLPPRNPQPVLGGVLLEVENGEVTLSIFNFEVSARTAIPADIDVVGRALVPGRLLGEIANRLPHAEVQLTLEDNRVDVRCGSAKYQLPAMPLEEFPRVPQISEVTGEVPADVFAEAISQVSLAAMRDDVMPLLTAVHMTTSENSLTLTATDRYRIAVRGIDWESQSGAEELSALVPAKFLAEVGKNFASDGNVQIAMSDSEGRELIGFVANNRSVTSQLLKGSYPPVERMFPQEDVDHYAVVNTADLLDAINRVAVVLDRNDAMRFTFADGLLTLEAHGSETAAANETVEIHLNGEETSLSLRAQLVIDGLRGANSEFTRVSFTPGNVAGRKGPILITGQRSAESADDHQFKYLMQPNLLDR